MIVKNTRKPPLPIHNLPRLARDTGIKFSERQTALLGEINEFSIRARYNDIKFKFHKKATAQFTKKYFQKSKELYSWLKKKV